MKSLMKMSLEKTIKRYITDADADADAESELIPLSEKIIHYVFLSHQFLHCAIKHLSHGGGYR
jgi:hypothetical protein